MADAQTTDATSTDSITAEQQAAIDHAASIRERRGENDADESSDDIEAMRDALKKANAEAKKFRLAAKANENELEKARHASMSEQEKAVATAKAEGRTEALREAGTRLVDAEVRAAAAGRNVDTDALLEGLDRSKFLDDDGNPDRDAIQAWIDRIAPAEQEQGFRAPNLEQGTRTNGGALALGSDPLTQSLKDKLGIR